MTKDEIITAICEDTGYSRKIATAVIESLFDNITLELSYGKKVQFAGFGTFEAKKYAAKVGRNVYANEPVKIPERYQPKFTAGKALKESVSKIK